MERKISNDIILYNCQFYTILNRDEDNGCPGWSGRFGNIFNYKYLIFPLHIHTNHWVVISIDFRNKIISYYDSMLSNTEEGKLKSNQILLYLNAEYKRFNNTNNNLIHYNTWSSNIKVLDDLEKQTNTYDCGIYSLAYVSFLAHEIDVHKIKQIDMAIYRSEIG